MNSIYILIASLIGALAGLGGAVIAGYFNLKAKKMELIYTRKVEAYKNLLEKIGAYVNDVNNLERYLEFVNAYYAVTIVASESLLEAFADDENITEIISSLHETDSDKKKKLKTMWTNSVNILIREMRRDLHKHSTTNPKLFKKIGVTEF
jgi:hypothetical protein